MKNKNKKVKFFFYFLKAVPLVGFGGEKSVDGCFRVYNSKRRDDGDAMMYPTCPG